MPRPFKGKGKDKNKGKRRDRGNALFKRKKFCRFTAEKVVQIDYKDIDVLKDFVQENGKIMPARVKRGEEKQYVTVPNSAIAYNPYGSTVFIVKSEGKGTDGKPKLVAAQRFVTTGLTRGDQVAVLSGLQMGEIVVTSGQLKLRNGTPVIVNNSVQPSNHPNPEVKDE